MTKQIWNSLMSSSDLLINNILICCLSKNRSETTSQNIDTQIVSTENDVYHCLSKIEVPRDVRNSKGP